MLTLEKRNKLIVDNLDYAEKIAAIQFKKTPPSIQFDDLKSAAFMGLVESANRYDGRKPFQIYAFNRILGEIKDYLRSLYWGGRNQSFKMSSWDENLDFEKKDEETNFDEMIKSLSPIGKNIIRKYYTEDKTLKEIGDELALSTTRIHQLLQVNLEQIRLEIS